MSCVTGATREVIILLPRGPHTHCYLPGPHPRFGDLQPWNHAYTQSQTREFHQKGIHGQWSLQTCFAFYRCFECLHISFHRVHPTDLYRTTDIEFRHQMEWQVRHNIKETWWDSRVQQRHCACYILLVIFQLLGIPCLAAKSPEQPWRAHNSHPCIQIHKTPLSIRNEVLHQHVEVMCF